MERPLSWLGWLVLFTGAAIYGWQVIRYGYSGPIRGSHALVPFVPHCYDILEVVPESVRWAVTLLMVAGGLSLPASLPLAWLKQRAGG